MVLQGCCLGTYGCGVDTTLLAPYVGIVTGCLPPNQVGVLNSGCPSLAVPLTGATLPGCCRFDGTCGNELDPLGCVQSQPSNGVQFCIGQGGAPGSGGFVGTGGVPTTGGFVGSGGFNAGGAIGAGGVSAGGTIGVGGVSVGGSGGVVRDEQCKAYARSDCEACACTTCYDSLTQCFQDAGCPAILQCANQTGCSGVDCLQPSTCQSVIEQNGGVGSNSVSLAITLFGCVQGGSCPCGFARPGGTGTAQ